MQTDSIDFVVLMDLVVGQIVEDINNGDMTAIVELLRHVPEEQLLAFLSEVTNG